MNLPRQFWLSVALFAPTLPACAAPEEATLPLKPYVEGLRLLDLTVDGTTGSFIFDSAGGLTVLSPEFLQAAKLESFGRVTGFRHTGQQLQMQRVPIHSVAAGRITTARTELTTFDLTSLLKGAPPVQGLVALDFFDGAMLTIDYARGWLTIESDESLRARTKGMMPLRIRAARDGGGAALDVFAAVESPHGLLWLLLDSGNAGPVLLAPHAAAQLELKCDNKRTTATLRLSPSFDYTCEAAIKEMIYDGLLNTDFFLRHVVTLDLRNMRAWVRKNSPPPEPGVPDSRGR